MKRVAITGATSFIGKYLIAGLLKKDYEVIAVVRRNSSKRSELPVNGKLRVIELDMEEYGTLADHIKETCDCFVSMAWNGTRGRDRDDYAMQRNNYECSMAALKSIVKAGCKKVISAGSQAEYGQYNTILREDTPCLPVTAYGKEKLHFYREADILCSKREVCFIEPRFISIYGPEDFENTMVISTVRKMLREEDCPFTEATQLWDFLYVEDAADAVIRLIDNDCVGGVYNIASGQAKPLREYIQEMHRICNSESRLLFGQIPYPPTGKVSLWADVSKLKKETGWIPSTTFQEGINNIIESCKRTDSE